MSEKNFKITLENYGRTISIEKSNEDIDIDEFLDIWRQLAMAATYHPTTIDNAIIELAEELKQQ